MRYIADNMFNGVAQELKVAGIECETVNKAIWGDEYSDKKERYDAVIFHFLLEKKFKLVPVTSVNEAYTIITADKDLARYCNEFGLSCHFVARQKEPSRTESKELAKKIISESR
jgi:CRISPR/Cas system CMR subunit Cmr4 (Cas7 group RAMP superfamily)